MTGGPEPSLEKRAGARPLLVIFFTVFLDLLGFGIIIPILPFYAERYGASPLVVTLLGASYSLMQFLFAPVWGRISDRVGRRPVIIIGVAMSAVGYTIFGLSSSLLMLFVARALAGIGNANIATAQAYIADVTTHENRARGMGLIGMAFGLGFILGPAIGALAAELGARLGGGDPSAILNQSSLPAFLAAFMAFIDLIIAALYLKESRRPGEEAPDAIRRGISLSALTHAARQPMVGALLLIQFVQVFGWSKMEGTFALLIERLYVDLPVGSVGAAQQGTRLTGIALTIVGVVSAVLQGGLIGRLSRRFGERRLLVTGLFINAAALSLLSYPPTFLAMVPVLLMMATANGLVNPSMSSLLSKCAPPGEQGTTLGLGQSLASLARSVGPVLGGWLMQTSGVHAPYLTGGAILCVSAFIGLTLKDPQPT